MRRNNYRPGESDTEYSAATELYSFYDRGSSHGERVKTCTLGRIGRVCTAAAGVGQRRDGRMARDGLALP